ncbi:hypothetical protein ACHAO5_001375 [Verticillium nonalfalfae]
MRIAAAVVSVLALAGPGAARNRRRDLGPDIPPSADTATAPKKFILELDQNANKNAIVKDLNERPGSRVLKVFDSEVFRGVAIESDSENTDSLEAIVPVRKAWHSKPIQLVPVIAGDSFSDDAQALNYSIHYMTGVDRLHEQGLFGKGVKVGVVDTGTEYTHPAVVTTQQEGTGEEVLIEAFLKAYEDGVSLCNHKYLVKADPVQMDIITASVGSIGGWSNNAWALVASRIVDQGVVVTIAAGNSGDVGPFFASSGGSAEKVLTVASVEASIVAARQFAGTFNLDGHSNRTILGYRPAEDKFPSTVVDWPIIPITLNITVEGDACEPLPEDFPDLSQTVPLVRVGGCETWQKQRWVQERGAKHILFYMDDNPIISFSGFGWEQSQWGLLSKDAGEAIVKTVIAGGNVTADFSLDQDSNYVAMVNAGGGRPSDFTSWGSTFDLELKPDIAGPGGRIFAPFVGHRYRDISGTSMATPYIAGVAALYIGKHGGRARHGAAFAQTLHARIASSGRSLPWSDGSTKDYGLWAPPIQLSWEKFSLNDTHHYSRYHQVDITNSGEKEIEYQFKVQDAGGFESYWTIDSASADTYAVPRIKDFVEIEPFQIRPQVSLPSGTFRVAPGQTKTAKFSFSVPEGLNASRIPVFGGKILISASNSEALSVPYFGVGASIKHEFDDLFYTSVGYPRAVSGVNRTDIKQKSSFTFDLSLGSQDFVKLVHALQWGTRELRWDIFESSYRERRWKYPPVVGENNYVGSVASFDVYNNLNYPVFDPASNDENNTFSYPLQDVSRDAPYESWWLGRLANGSTIAPGKYKMRFAALAPFGNPKASDNWHVWDAPEIEVL